MEFDAVDTTGDEPLLPRYNVAPTDRVPVIRRSRRAGGRVVAGMRWGLLPAWKQGRLAGAPLFNARAESVADRPAFRAAFARRRCLVPADGWYEWTPGPDGRQPWYITARGGGGLVFAGLWEVSDNPDGTGAPVFSCTVVTTASAGPLQAVHDRMPLLLARDRWTAWLEEEPADRVDALLQPVPDVLDALEWWPVGPAVGNVRNDDPSLRVPVDSAPPAPVAVEGTLF